MITTRQLICAAILFCATVHAADQLPPTVMARTLHAARVRSAMSAAPAMYLDTNNWLAVWDCEFTNTTQMLDVTGNGNDVSNCPSVLTGPVYTTVTNSPLKHSWRFTVANSNYFVGGQKLLNGVTQMTVVAWAKANPDCAGYAGLLAEPNINYGINGLRYNSGNNPGLELCNNATGVASESPAMPTNVWHFLAMRWTQSASRTAELYVDGVYQTNNVWNTPIVTTEPFKIGYYGWLNRFFGGEFAFGAISLNYLTTNALNELMAGTVPTNYNRVERVH